MSTTLPTVQKPSNIGREGVYLHNGSGQYVSRLGFELNKLGKRVRAFQYLGADPEQATVRHVRIVSQWKHFKANWAFIRDTIRPGLPEAFRNTAELDLPVWILPEWIAAAENASLSALLDKITDEADRHVNTIDASKQFLAGLARSQNDWLSMLEPAVRARVLQAIQPPANEIAGFAADAERLTVEQAKALYLADMKARIGLPEDGIKPTSYQNADRMLRLGLALKVKDANGVERYAIDPQTMMHELTRDDLVSFKRAWLGKVTAADIAKRTAANYCKCVQFFLAWCYKRERILTRRIADLEDVFRFTDINPINIADYATVKDDLKAILAEATDRVRLYILLAMNCGYYQVDIGRLKLSEIQTHGGDNCIVRRREKTSHQNDFAACHALWPETWKLLKAELATADTTKNPSGLALLNEDGRPLYLDSADAAKIDNVTSCYWRVIQSVNEARAKAELPPMSLPFKQFRKLGATAMNNIAGETVQKLYRSASFDGADRFYVRGDFSTLAAALKKWRQQLKADKIV